MNITVVGLGYVGSTLTVLLAKKHQVIALDNNHLRVETMAHGHSPIMDPVMEACLKEAHPFATENVETAFEKADYVVIATNTQLDEARNQLNTSSVETVMAALDAFFNDKDETSLPVVVIRSTVPVGFTKGLKARYPRFTFLFCPEFLREKSAMDDVLHPSRIIVGCDTASQSAPKEFARMLQECVENKEVPLLFTGTEEAESIKLFANSYLALRVAFFNELDSFATYRGLDAQTMIKGVCLDPRIGDYYNRPSEGFGGACLPKDTRQLVADFKDLPEVLIRAALEANDLRKEFLEGRQERENE